MIEVESYEPFPKQQEFHANPAKYRLFGGAAGPGKTKALLWEAILQANEWPNVDTLLLRRTFPELEESLLREFRRSVDRDLYVSFNESKHVVTWRNGSTTRFGYCQRENDVYQYQGAEFLFIGFDELTHFTLRQWQYLTSRNRCPIPQAFPCMAGATNPGNIGHAWVKALWIDKTAAPGMEDPQDYDPSDYSFISARIRDNPIYANDAGYLKTLQKLPSNLRRALLDGDWDVFAGQYFDLFDPATMCVPPQSMGLRQWQTRWISIDWGFDHPSAVYWHCRDSHRVNTYREWVQNRLTPRMLAEGIVERSVERLADGRSQPETISAVYLSPDAFASRTGEATIAEQVGDVLSRGGLLRPAAADNDRVGGWMLMYGMLDAHRLNAAAERTGSAERDLEWRIGDNCVELIRCLPTLVRDEKHVEDVQKMLGDDPADSVRYGLKSMLSPGNKPLGERIEENVVARIGKPLDQVRPEEYTHVMIQRAAAEQEETRQTRHMRISRRRH